ncbi:MAG: CHAT domain-containing protein [Bacteroidota bacterium]
MLLALVLGFLQIGAPADSNLAEQSKSQANYYISNIEEDRNVDENLWALTVLTASNPEIRKKVEQDIQENSYTNDLLGLFRDIETEFPQQLEKVVFESGSDQLMVDLLLVTEKNKNNLYQEFRSKFESNFNSNDSNYKPLFNAIVNDADIDESIISHESFTLPHFFLLYRTHDHLKESYINWLADSWSYHNDSEQSLSASLYHAAYLRILYLKSNYGETDKLFSPLTNNDLFPNSDLKLRLFKYLDYSMYRLGYYDRSLQIVREHTLPLAEYLEKEKERINIKQLQGVYLYSIGKIKEAELIYEQILKEADQKNINLPKSSLYNNLALAYYKLGNYDSYLDLQLQALETAQKKDNYTHQLSIFNNLFIFYRSNNDFEDALHYLEEAMTLAEEKDQTEQLGKIYTLYGSFYRNFKSDYDKAHKYFKKANDILDSKNNAKFYIDLLKDQAESFEEQKLFSKALQKHNQIIELVSDKDKRDHIDAIVNKASIKLKEGEIGSANSYINTFKPLDLTKLNFSQIIKAKTVEAEYLFQTGNTKKAFKILEPTLNQIVVRAQGSTDLKSGFWHVEDEYLDAFELAASIYMKTGQPDKAVEKLDQLKTINDASLYQNPLVKSSLLDESELTEYKQLTDQLDAIRKKLLTAPEEDQFDIRQQINRLNTKKRKYDQKLTKNIDTDPISIRDIQNKLSAKELILHITELNDQFYIAKISRSDVSLDTLTIDNHLTQLLDNSIQQIATDNTNLDSLYQISEILKLEDIPNYVEKITLIPDSHFYQLPLDILPLEKPASSYSYGDVTYAVERFKTQYLTTLEDFIAPKDTRDDPRKKNNYAGYGVSNFEGYNNQSLVPLPYTQSEVTSIANTLTQLSNIQTFTNEESTKAKFKETAPGSRIIHLATHSEVSERDPMFSTVYFSKSSTEQDSTFEDQFFAYELFELNLDNEMIMLNSCESGSGSYIQGTGVMGISRALRYAGAESLILNLWSVNDMLASDFAIHFYSQLNEGKSKAQALRATKQYFLNSKNADPHFWGPYMLIGNTDPIVEPDQNANMAMAGIFLFYFLLMIGLSYLAQQSVIFDSQKEST